MTQSWTLVAIVCLGAAAGGGKFTSLSESYFSHITISFSAGAILTSFEVGRTPQFVDFRNFKVSPKFTRCSHLDSPPVLCPVGRDRLACLGKHHRSHHIKLPSLVFVNSSAVCLYPG